MSVVGSVTAQNSSPYKRSDPKSTLQLPQQKPQTIMQESSGLALMHSAEENQEQMEEDSGTAPVSEILADSTLMPN